MKNVLRLISILLICSVIAGLLGCAGGDEIYPELTETELNIPQYKTNETLTFTADVYYESVDTGELTACERVIEHSNSISRAEAVLNALSQEPEDKKLRSAMIKGLTFESLVMSNGICDVYITGVFPSFTDSWYTLCSAVALTLCSTYDEIDAVNVMFDGKSVGYYSMLMGLLDEDNARSGSRSADDDCIPELYYVGKDVYGAQSVIAYKGENAPIKCDTPLIDAARTLIEALYEPSDAELTGIPRELSVFGIAFRSGESITMEYDARISPSPEPAETDDGEPPFDVAYDTPLNIMEVVFSAKDDTRSVDFNAVAAMVTLTLTSSIPEIDGVRICCSEDGVQTDMGVKWYTRDYFRPMMANAVNVSVRQGGEAALTEKRCLIPYQKQFDPEYRMRLFLDVYASLPQLESVAGLEFASIYVSGGTAVVNWRAGFAERLSAIFADDLFADANKQLQLFIFGAVNTLCELEEVSSVIMLDGGRRMGRIGNIYLGNRLYKTPGIAPQK